MRARLLLGLMLLPGACGDPDSARKQALADAAAEAGKVDCATEGATGFAPVCTVERTSSAEALVLTIRSPSGSFRRLLVTRDGRGVVAADGADPANVSIAAGDRIEVAIAGDRYLLPATVKK
ncbi:MAG TPA: hypothetical protein VK472_05250 [Allosphingosinicella sp.]|nr:hypothetical protein [Allosphingosinicella sp.]